MDFDPVSVVDELVENAATRQLAPRFRDDDDVGIEPAQDLRDIEARSPAPPPAFDAPLGVERGERELR
jgi:hypothetical protein